MSNNRITNINKLLIESRTWLKAITVNMSVSDKKTYEARKEAVDLYLSGKTLKEIERLTGINKTHIREFVDRCANLDPSGLPVGYVGLIPRITLKQREGSFAKLMNDKPEIRDELVNKYFNNTRSKWDKSASFVVLHKLLLRKLIEGGLKETEYPFNTAQKGYGAMIRFLKNMSSKHPSASLNRYGKEARQLYRSTHYFQPLHAPVKRPFTCVEIDGHKIDALFTVEVVNEYGDIVQGIARRIWILVVIDVATRVVLGYTISVNQNYNRFDILECIQNAIMPHEPFKFERFNFPVNKNGFHSIKIPSIKWALFDEIALDNALAHLSNDVIDNLENLGVSINFGPVANPLKRAIVERFFRTLEDHGFHRMPSTTGSNPSDVKRINAERDAIDYKITLQEIYEIAEIVISDYNSQPHSSLSGFSPLEIMEQRINRGLIPSSFVPQEKRKDFSVMKIYQQRKVQGNQKKGIRPYINFEGYKYSGSVISSCYLLVGDYITLEIDPLDIRTLNAYNEYGKPIGQLVIKGQMIATAISLKNNKLLKEFIKENNLKDSHIDDVIGNLTDSLENKMIKDKTAATHLASLRNDAKKRSPNSNILPQNRSELETSEENDQFDDNDNKQLLSDEELMKKWSDPSKRTW